MSGLLQAARANLGGIILYLALAILSWRIHSYIHLYIATLYGYDVVVGFEAYLSSPEDVNAPFMILPTVFNAFLAVLGAFLVYRFRGLIMVSGYYLLLFNSLASLLSPPIYVYLGYGYMEMYIRLLVGGGLSILLLITSLYPPLGLKRDCAYWLLILTVSTVSTAIVLDIISIELFRMGVLPKVNGVLLSAFLFDVLSLSTLPFMVRRYTYEWVG